MTFGFENRHISFLRLYLYVQELICALCKGKFEYESNIYRGNTWYAPLDLKNNREHTLLYTKMAEILDKYNLKDYGLSELDLTGEILKYFSSCTEHHCESILNNVGEIELSAKYNLQNAPILWIVDTLRSRINRNSDLIFEDSSSTSNFNFEEHISIYWAHTQNYLSNDDGEDLLDKFYLEKEEKILIVLQEFQDQWNINYFRLDNDYYSINFKTYKQYYKFQKCARELSKPHYIFEGDVLDILKTVTYMGNMVELRLSSIFDIPNTLAQILRLKEVHA